VSSSLRFVSDRSAFENAANSNFTFEVQLDMASDEVITVRYESIDGTANAGDDYEETSGTLTFGVGETSKSIIVPIVVDNIAEGDEDFTLKLFDPINGYLQGNRQSAIGTIRNDDNDIAITSEGYVSADSYPGLDLAWSDEFEGDAIDLSNWGYDLGTGNGGWGNNELQVYTDSPENSFIQDGHLVIVASEGAPGQYTSARLKSQGLRSFQYGRVDVRALLPVDQGSWPAIWMLGDAFGTEGWPSCGEIDIMELVGSNPRRVHGTAHWGADFSQHQYEGEGVSIPFPETFADEFHVFSIIWEENSIRWLLDDVEYFSLDPTTTTGQPYPFNESFFFILNVAIGGDWPGNPNETSTYPEVMAVDYVRVFQ